MKLYIRSSESNKESHTIRIYIEVYLNNPNIDIKASEDPDVFDPISNADGTVNAEALENWEMFVQRVALKLKPIFKVVHIDVSPPESSLTSRYFWVYGRNEDGTINIEVLIRLRLSDHPHSIGYKIDKEYSFANDEGQKHKYFEKINYQPIDIGKILVMSGDEDNEITHVHTSYTSALRDVYQQALKQKEDLVEKYGETVDDWGEDYEYKSPKYTQKDFDEFTESFRKSHGLPEK